MRAGRLTYDEWAAGMDKLRADDGTAENAAAFEAEMTRMLRALALADAERRAALADGSGSVGAQASGHSTCTDKLDDETADE